MLNRQKLIDITSKADNALDAGDFDTAETLYAKAIVIAEKLYGKNSVSVCSLLHSLAHLHIKRGDQEHASLLKSRIQQMLRTPIEISA